VQQSQTALVNDIWPPNEHVSIKENFFGDDEESSLTERPK
jgi:hypothetical protein